jgi:hypothetical protein
LELGIWNLFDIWHLMLGIFSFRKQRVDDICQRLFYSIHSKRSGLLLLIVSHRTLIGLAAVFWFVGGLVLLIKGGNLLLDATALKPGRLEPWIAIATAVVIGGIKAKFFFTRSCRKNIARIAALNRPRIWQFFRPFFFLALLLMILIGATLSKFAHSGYHLLLCIAALDLTIAIALLGSGYIFWSEKPM